MATSTAAGAPPATTDFERDLGHLDHEIERLSRGGPSATYSRHKAIRLVSLQYRRASLLGSWPDLKLVGESLDALVTRLGLQPDLCLLQGTLGLTLHRLDAVRAALHCSPALAGSWHGRALEADALVQEGRYDNARRVYEAVLLEARTWQNLARLAYVHGVTGDREMADRLYTQAIDEITAKEMRACAWVEVMRGEHDVACGAHDLAMAHYERAGAAYSGYWLVDEHVAELLAAEGSAEQAVALYLDVIARVARPELIQALGDAYARAGRPDEARGCYDRALAGYLDSVHQGDVHYVHHLAELYADVLRDGPEAVRWARTDFELRPNALVEAALAWAQFRNGQPDDALRHIQHALASGARSAQLLRQSAEIHRACGDLATAEQHAHMAAEISPSVTGSHAHR